MAKKCVVQNPVSVNQLVEILPTDCFGTSGGLNPILEVICNHIKEVEELNIPTNTTLEDAINEALESIEHPEYTNPLDIDYNRCKKDDWSCSNCSTCIPEGNIIQALINRVNSMKDELQKKCSEIEELRDDVENLRNEISNLDCCNQESLLNRIKKLENESS